MRKKLLVILAFSVTVLLYSCNNKSAENSNEIDQDDTVVNAAVSDSLFLTDNEITIHNLKESNNACNTELTRTWKQNDSLKTELLLVKFKMASLKKYVNIVINNPSQLKYLRGWSRRATQ